MAARLIDRRSRLVWLGQDDGEDEAMPPPMTVTDVPRDGRWTPGEKIMLAMLAVNALWFGWTIWNSAPGPIGMQTNPP